jgi:hypothetical protein
MRGRGALVVLALTLGACAPAVGANGPSTQAGPARSVGRMADRLYFGRGVPGGGTVSDSAWAAFLAEVVTPRFPDGLTVLRGEGQWRGEGGAVVREPTFIVEIYHAGGAGVDAALGEIAAEYRRRFRQESVMRVRSPAEVQFHE